MTSRMRARSIALLLPSLFLLTACMSSLEQRVYIDPQLAQRNVVQVEAFVQASPVQAIVAPMDPPAEPPRAVLFPFRLAQEAHKPIDLSRQITRIVHQNWVGQQVFPALEFAESFEVRSVDAAIREAARRGADLAVIGVIPYFMDGGQLSDTSVALRADVYDVKSRQMIWSVASAGRMEPGITEDFILFVRKNRLPQDPAFAVTNVVATRIGEPVRNWARTDLAAR